MCIGTKNKYKNRLNIESYLSIQLPNIDHKIPDIVLTNKTTPSITLNTLIIYYTNNNISIYPFIY